MSSLVDRLFAEKKAFKRLRKQAESKVVRWAYWDPPDWYWNPEYMVKYWNWGPPQRTQKGKAGYAYGYDDRGRVIIIHKFGAVDPAKLERVQFLRYGGDRIVGSVFGPEGATLYDVFEATLSGGRIARVEQVHFGYPPCDWKTIVWEGDHVASVLEGMRGRKAHRQVNYSKKGKVLEDLDLSRPVKRKPLPKGVTMNSLAKEIRQRLVKAVVATVAKAKIKESVYCLALNYDCEGNPLLPPELGMGLDSERQARLKRGGRDAKHDIWDAVNFPLFGSRRTELKDRELDRACSLYNRELEYEGTDEPARKLILQAAADLAKLNWKGKLNATDDFIVYAVDTDGADLHKNLKISVSPKQLARMKAAKLL
jgi:hypothetical protein